MTFKTLTIATAIVFMCGLGAVAPASAQNAAPAAPAAADANAGPNVSVPSSAPKEGTAAAKVAAADQSTPYGIEHLWVTGSWIDRFIMVVLAIMSAGTWYIFISKFID